MSDLAKMAADHVRNTVKIYEKSLFTILSDLEQTTGLVPAMVHLRTDDNGRLISVKLTTEVAEDSGE